MRIFAISFLILMFPPVFSLAALPVPESIITPEYLKEKYQRERISVLIIPGHINSARTGGQFRGVKEGELTKEAADLLAGILKSDRRFVVFTFADVEPYFQYPEHIKEFRKEAYQNAKALTDRGIVQKNQTVEHVTVPSEDTLTLYGINKWARDHRIDIVLHLHFNDYPRRYQRLAGKYSGFAIYIPERQLLNYQSSQAVASAVVGQLKEYFPVSDYPPESSGIVEDQDLIAVGAPSSFYGAAMLIEYGYLYEPQFIDRNLRPLVLRELAHQTYLGLKGFFDGTFSKNFSANSLLPYHWTKYLRRGFKSDLDVYALQVALLDSGLYPPLDESKIAKRSKNDCPLNGTFGGCTERALKAFQDKYGIDPTGFAGPATIKKLNELYGQQKENPA